MNRCVTFDGFKVLKKVEIPLLTTVVLGVHPHRKQTIPLLLFETKSGVTNEVGI